MHPGATPLDEETPLLSSQNVINYKKNSAYIYLVACMSAIGGFLFGYDTGIISGAMIFIKDVFNLNEWWQESIVSSTLLAAWIFSIMSGMFTDKLGRKPVILLSSIIFIVGSLLMAFAMNEIPLIIGRLVVGAAVGLASMTVPMYIAEVAPSNIRGQLVMINMCCITGGQFFASIIAYWFSFIKGGDGWRYMLGFAAIPAAIQFIGFLAMPESPRWLVGQRRYEDARRALARLRGNDVDVSYEFESIKKYSLKAKREQEALEDPEQSTFQRILATQPVRKALFVGCLLQMIQQISGINTVMYYSASIFEMSGVYDKQKALILSAGTAFVNFVMTIVGFVLVERAGRRKLTLISLFGVIISLCILAAGFQFAYYNSPQVTEIDDTIANHPCDSHTLCNACSGDSECGFCFTREDSTSQNFASCLKVDNTHHDQSMIGKCQFHNSTASPHPNQFVWAYEWCPSSYSWLTMLGMVMYLFFFAPGMGPMPWTINSEIYPSWARSFCLSATTSVNWIVNLLISMTFLTLTGAITKQGAFYLYAIMALLGFVYFMFVLPETRGQSLEDLENLFASKEWLQKKESSKSSETNNKTTVKVL